MKVWARVNQREIVAPYQYTIHAYTTLIVVVVVFLSYKLITSKARNRVDADDKLRGACYSCVLACLLGYASDYWNG